MNNKPLFEMKQAEFDPIMQGYKLMLLRLKDIHESMSAYVWNEISHTAREAEKQIADTMKILQMLQRSALK